MIELKAIRDKYDPYGGRAIGSREMLDIDEAEYGGEMLYVNKSKKHPMWQMEYHRDEGLRKYWDEKSYPYHKEGAGPLYRGKPALEYNHNMDIFAKSMVDRWYDYYLERPGTGKRVNAGGVKIIFSDTNTHYRGEANYRTSGVTDAMRIPKDAYYVHRVMWGSVNTIASKMIIENGAELRTTAAVTQGSAMSVLGDEGGVINNSNDYAVAAAISGTNLMKKGSGWMKLNVNNTSLNRLIINGGTVQCVSCNTPAKTVEFRNGTLSENTGTGYSIDVAANGKGTWNLVNDANYSNKITGKGTLTISCPPHRVL